MTDKEALKLALEALGLYQAAGFGNSTDFNKQHEAFYKAQIAITAIQQAMLAAPVQEPVAYLHQCRKKPELKELSFKKHEPELFAKGYKAIPLSDATPPAAKRQWVGLTDERRKAIYDECQGLDVMKAIIQTEAKLKEEPCLTLY